MDRVNQLCNCCWNDQNKKRCSLWIGQLQRCEITNEPIRPCNVNNHSLFSSTLSSFIYRLLWEVSICLNFIFVEFSQYLCRNRSRNSSKYPTVSMSFRVYWTSHQINIERMQIWRHLKNGEIHIQNDYNKLLTSQSIARVVYVAKNSKYSFVFI